mmetsp:Transcript_6200/g.8929  ORF Transcript_6200/g.8929 Transcript_6200/m.8929 type:complete len:156 (-) Transcript_6200:2274-2741(-)
MHPLFYWLSFLHDFLIILTTFNLSFHLFNHITIVLLQLLQMNTRRDKVVSQWHPHRCEPKYKPSTKFFCLWDTRVNLATHRSRSDSVGAPRTQVIRFAVPRIVNAKIPALGTDRLSSMLTSAPSRQRRFRGASSSSKLNSLASCSSVEGAVPVVS